jgi:phage terminase large subunit-like protein
MKAGPKAALTAPPLDLRRLPKRGGSRAIAFIERYVTVPKGTGAGRRLKLRPWQREIAYGLLNEPRPRQGLVSMPAGNAKSTLGAGLGLYGLLGDGVQGAQVPIIASDKRQAGIIQRTARRMVELDEDLSEQVQLYHDYLYVPRTDSVLQALPAELAALQGWDPSMAIIDELHVVTTDVYESIAARAGKRDRSLLLALSTPPRDGDTDSIMWRLVEHGREGTDPSFYYVEFAAPPGSDIDDEAVWYQANPALGDFLHIDALRATRRTMRDSTFRAWRLGQWPKVIDDAWLPAGVWDACADPLISIADHAEVVLGFDGSFSGDCTVLVAVTVSDRPHVHLVELWEAPEGARDWRVPVVEVEDAIRAACQRWRVLEVAADPYRWQRSLELLDAEGITVMEYPQSPARMGPATARFYSAVVDRLLSHDGAPALARHVANAVLREDSRGARLAKEHKDSKRRIDAAVAAVMAHDRAAQLAGTKPLDIYV